MLRYRTVVSLTAAFVLLGCAGQDATTPLIPDPENVYAALRLDYKTAVISLSEPHNTLQLHVTPISLTGSTIATDETPLFSRVNPLDTAVTVSSTGLVSAQTITAGTRIMVQLWIDNVLRADTITIMVRNDDPIRPIARMEFFPVEPDSNWRWAGERTTINTQRWIRLFDEAGDTIPPAQAPVYVWAKHPEIFGSGAGGYLFVGPIIGETYVYAQTYAYGKVFLDSALFRRVDPPVRVVVVDRVVPADAEGYLAFFPAKIVAKAGTTIAFMNRFGSVVKPSYLISPLFPPPPSWDGGNRIPLMRDYSDSRGSRSLVWVDSIDIQFENADLVAAADAYGTFTITFTGASAGTAVSGPIVPNGSGNIPAFSVLFCTHFTVPCGEWSGPPGGIIDEGIRYRKFPVPGTYRYTSTRFPNVSGTIIITE